MTARLTSIALLVGKGRRSLGLGSLGSRLKQHTTDQSVHQARKASRRRWGALFALRHAECVPSLLLPLLLLLLVYPTLPPSSPVGVDVDGLADGPGAEVEVQAALEPLLHEVLVPAHLRHQPPARPSTNHQQQQPRQTSPVPASCLRCKT